MSTVKPLRQLTYVEKGSFGSRFWRLKGVEFVWGSILGTVADVMAGSMSPMSGHVMRQEAERRNHQSPRVSFGAWSQ